MKTFETVADVLDNARKFHCYAANFYKKLQSGPTGEREKMLLGYMVSHEQAMEQQLVLHPVNTSPILAR